VQSFRMNLWPTSLHPTPEPRNGKASVATVGHPTSREGSIGWQAASRGRREVVSLRNCGVRLHDSVAWRRESWKFAESDVPEARAVWGNGGGRVGASCNPPQYVHLSLGRLWPGSGMRLQAQALPSKNMCRAWALRRALWLRRSWPPCQLHACCQVACSSKRSINIGKARSALQGRCHGSMAPKVKANGCKRGRLRS
jgi:hypothetical protein